jgi:tetratricopeptide (TPR) repeat protein
MAEQETRVKEKRIAQVRALPSGYFTASFVLGFVSALLTYLDYLWFALPVAVISCFAVPLLWLTDKIKFDGRRIRRTGLMPRLLARLTGIRDRLKLSDIEQVETIAFSGLKRGRNLYYTYRTTITGKSATFAISSRHAGYRDIIRTVLPRLSEDLLDSTSIDLRDYLAEFRDIGQRARESEIPSSDVLDSSFREINLRPSKDKAPSPDFEKASHLHRLANELRISGRLLQALEAFRRAAVLQPGDARLLFEFAECIRSVAGSEKDPKLERKALAMMRLAERHASADSDLLSRIGEFYFRTGDWHRAGLVFKRVTEKFGENFRTLRGLAELSLREGKLAHVIHNFAAAERSASTSALRRWTRTEVDYFSHLNQDEEYMDLEISRVNLLDTLARTRRSSVRIALVGFVVIASGLLVGDELISNIGWAVSGISILLWIVMILMGRMLSPRIPFELMETDE